MKYYAVVMGDWHFNSLGLIRSLGERGVPVVYLNMSEGGYGEHSRYTVKTYHSSDSIYEELLKVLDENEGTAVIFPSCDRAALVLDEKYSKLSGRCIVPNLGGNAKKYMDKQAMCAIAEKSGFNVPACIKVNFNENTYEEIKEFGFPCIIKPLLSVEGIKADISVCGNCDELEKAIEVFNSSGNAYKQVLVQRFVHGTENLMVGYCGCKVRKKRVLLYGQLEKTREYPIDRGSTSYAVIKKDTPFVDIDALNAFLERVGFEGLFDIDIKVVDNIPYFIEINFRNGAISYAFTAAGFNIPYTWYCEMTCQKVDPIEIRELLLMCERDDLNHVKDKNISIFKWLHDIRRTDVFMLHNRNDPQPFVQAYGKAVSRVLDILRK